MARILDDIFNECYERIRSGESIESCLRSYPQYRAQLEPLLKTTFDIGRRVSYIHPRPEFKHWARVRIESAQRYPRQQTRAETPAASTWWRHGWAVAVSIGIVLMLTTGSTMAASSQALPGEPLYPIKQAKEQVQRTFAISDTQKAQFETDLANIRAAELEALANAGKTNEAAKAAERYNDQYYQAVLAIVKAGGTEPQLPVFQPPTETTPPVVTTTPPVVATPPVVTTASENTTPPETITPPVVVTPPAVTTTSENITPPTVTTTSENITPPEATTPATTETQPTTTTTQDKDKATKSEQLIKSLHNSTSISITALKEAKEKASQEDKRDWQNAIDKVSKKSQTKSSTTKDTTSQSDNNTGKEVKPKYVPPSQNQPSYPNWHNYGH